MKIAYGRIRQETARFTKATRAFSFGTRQTGWMLSASYLSMVENEKVNPSISRLKEITDGLGITIVDFFQSLEGEEVVLRKENRIRAELVQSCIEIKILVPPLPADKQLDAPSAIIHPGGSSGGEYSHPGAEFGLLLKGSLLLVIDGVTYQLIEGDSFYFDSPSRHSFRNPGKEETHVIWVNYPPSF